MGFRPYCSNLTSSLLPRKEQSNRLYLSYFSFYLVQFEIIKVKTVMDDNLIVDFISSTRGGRCLVINDYKFNKKHTDKDGVNKWVCRQRGCGARCFTRPDDVIVSYNLDHNHVADLHKLSRQVISSECKRKATEDISARPLKIINQQLATSSYGEHIDGKDLMLVRRAVWDSRRKVLPPVPKTVSDVHDAVDSVQHVTTHRGEKFVMQDDRENHMIILGCESNLNQLAAADVILMDGTFDCCPKFFAQVFTIHCAANGHYIPLLFCLLAKKLEDTYKTLFSKINEMLRNFSPKKIIVDFEVAIHNAAQITWPSAQITGCRFHLTQNW